MMNKKGQAGFTALLAPGFLALIGYLILTGAVGFSGQFRVVLLLLALIFLLVKRK